MNKVILLGRLTADPTKNGVVKFTVAVDRFKDGADFIGCTAFSKTGEFAEKYLKKGTKICLEGHIQTGSYEKDGKKIYTQEVIAERIEFAESKKVEEKEEFHPLPDNMELPFT